MITLSVVSHGQGVMLDRLLADLGRVASTCEVEIIVTENIVDTYPLANVPTACEVRVIRNTRPQGFGANHNQAFEQASGDVFCILNPDVRILHSPFALLHAELTNLGAGAVAPAIVTQTGSIEDSARHFPTPWSLASRHLGGPNGAYEFSLNQAPLAVDWVAGMFVMFDSSAFRQVGGFDDRYFMYCEDIDISARLWRVGRPVYVCPSVSAIHDAQRASRRSLKHLRWHLASYARYFSKQPWHVRPRSSVASL